MSRRTTRLLDRNGRPTALICGNDVLATGALYGAAAAGLSVPEDLTVVGIGDFRGAGEIEPALTTVRIPARQIGREAGATLAAAITDPDWSGGGVHCQPNLIVRASSAPPAQAGPRPV